MRKLVLLLACLALAGCAEKTMTNPTTGATATCTGLVPDINLWSTYPSCVETYISEGYHSVR